MIKPSNLARFESRDRVPTLIVLEKYANALGKHIEIKICDDWQIFIQRIICDNIKYNNINGNNYCKIIKSLVSGCNLPYYAQGSKEKTNIWGWNGLSGVSSDIKNCIDKELSAYLSPKVRSSCFHGLSLLDDGVFWSISNPWRSHSTCWNEISYTLSGVLSHWNFMLSRSFFVARINPFWPYRRTFMES